MTSPFILTLIVALPPSFEFEIDAILVLILFLLPYAEVTTLPLILLVILTLPFIFTFEPATSFAADAPIESDINKIEAVILASEFFISVSFRVMSIVQVGFCTDDTNNVKQLF